MIDVLVAPGYRRAIAGIALVDFGAWHDVAMWQRPLARTEDRPRAPVPYTALPAGASEPCMAVERA